MIKKNIISYIIVFACFFLISCSKDGDSHAAVNPLEPVAGRNYSAKEVTFFKQITLHASDIIIKWPGHISFYIVENDYPFMTTEIDSILSEVNSLLGDNLVLTRTDNRAESDVQIYLTDHETFIATEPSSTRPLSDYVGLTSLQWNINGIISGGIVFVDMKRTAGDTVTQRHAIYHEIMHALGFYGHTTLPDPNSILYVQYQDPVITDYTSFDKRMMQLLYNPSVLPGMNEVEFNKVIKNL